MPHEPSGEAELGLQRCGTGPRVVLVHGFTQTRQSWAPIVERLGHAHEVLTVDAPGHGGSARIRADLVTAAGLLGAAGGSASYIGYSMGGRMCLHLAIQHPELVRRLVLLGATAGLTDPSERAQRRAADDALADQLEAGGDAGLEGFLERWLRQPLFATLSTAQAGLQARRENTASGLASSLRLSGTGAQDSLWDRLAGLAMPVLVVAGARDEKFTSIGRQLVTAIGDNARLELVAGAGHAAHLEQPARFATIVLRFLSGPSGPSGPSPAN